MPTLIRLFVVLLVLAGLAYGAMIGLVMMVQPADKEVTVRIPARDLVPSRERDPLVQREIDTTRTVESPPPVDPAPAAEAPAAETPAATAPADAAAAPTAEEEGSIVTLSPGVE
jgi:hypothetical protein